MRLELAKAVLATAFGRQAAHPLGAAWLRLAASVLGAAGLSLYLSRALAKLSLAQDLPVVWAAAFFGVAGFVIVGLVLMSLSMATGNSQGPPALARLATVWPLNRWAIWLIEALPSLLIWLILMIPCSWLTVTASRLAAQPVWLMLVALSSGAVGALCLSLWQQIEVWRRSLLFVTLIVTGIYSLEQSLNRGVALYAIGGLAPVLLIPGYLRSVSRRKLADRPRSPHRLLKLPRWLAERGWFLLKILRNRHSKAALIFSLILIVTATVVAVWRGARLSDRTSLLLLGALCSVAVAADARGLCRRHRALELHGFGRLSFFVKHQLGATWLASLALTSPLLVINLGFGSSKPGPLVAYWLGLQLFASSCGLVGGSLFAPGVGEFGTQFLAATTATALFIVLPKLIGLGDGGLLAVLPGWLALSGLSVLAIYTVEYQRGRRYGHA